MAFEVGQINEFTDVNANADPVVMTAAKAVNLPRLKGVVYQGMAAPQTAILTKEFEIRSRSKTVRDGKLGETAWDNSATSGLSIAADSVKGITVGSQLKVGSEVVVVKSVSRSAGTVDVFSRGFGATTPAAHAAGSKFTVIGYAGRDVDLKNVEGNHERTLVYKNGVQTIFHVVDWSKHGELVRKGLTPSQAQLIVYQEEMFKVAEDLARMAIWGVKNIPQDYNDPFGSAGLMEQLQDNVGGNRPVLIYDLEGGNLTEDKLKAVLDEVFRTGNPDTIYCSQGLKKVFDAFIKADASHIITVERGERTAGTGIDFYEYEGIRLRIEVDADLNDTEFVVVNKSKIRKGWLENDMLRTADEPTQSSREFRKSIQGSIGFMVDDVGYEHILVKNVGGGATERIYQANLINASINAVTTPKIETISADPVAAAAGNKGSFVVIGSAFTGTNIETAAMGEVYMSTGSAWVKIG